MWQLYCLSQLSVKGFEGFASKPHIFWLWAAYLAETLTGDWKPSLHFKTHSFLFLSHDQWPLGGFRRSSQCWSSSDGSRFIRLCWPTNKHSVYQVKYLETNKMFGQYVHQHSTIVVDMFHGRVSWIKNILISKFKSSYLTRNLLRKMI